MGEYEDRYPDAYGRGEEAARPPDQQAAGQAMPPRPVRDRSFWRTRFGLGAAAETAPAWQHAPSAPRLIEPTAPPPRSQGAYRGVGPRGYVRSPERIYEDICDRLTDNPFIDASDIEVSVSGTEVALAGSVDSAIALRQAEAIAQEVAGVGHVRNRLIVRPAGGQRAPSPAETHRAMGTERAR